MIKINHKNLSGEVSAISSKSFAHRILICASLCNKKTKIYIDEYSKDILATISCIKNLGAEVDFFEKYIIVKPVLFKNLNQEQDKKFFCSESGTTYRFIVPIASSIYKNTFFFTEGILNQRPMRDLLDILGKNGCQIKYDNELKINGKFNFKDVEIKGNISSQYISALLLSAVLQNKDVSISVLDNIESESYINITLKVMKDFGVDVLRENNIFKLNKNQSFLSPDTITVEGDWSSAAFFLVAGALSENGIIIKNLDFDSLQGDKEILNILKKYGAKIEICDKFISIKKRLQKPFNIDVKNIPDLAPILGVLAAGTKGISTISNIKRLRIKESDRVNSTIAMINNLGGMAFEKDDKIFIYGRGDLSGGKVNAFNDHRIAMSTCIATILCNGEVFLDDEKCIDKSYPRFLEDFKKLGGDYVVYNR